MAPVLYFAIFITAPANKYGVLVAVP